ncbi:MAG: phosphoethanolamine--lipid A transferase EptA [Bacteroidia bacterium]|nr:phosphoethanolamine--lipid A transferase EptA [Bacteroidia bacterium]
MFTKNIKLTHFVILMSLLNFLFFHYAFFKYIFNNLNYKSFNGILLVVSTFALVVIFNAFAFYLFMFLSRIVGKFLLALTFIISSIATYFVNTYNAIIDEGMIGNVINTNYSEASSFFSAKLLLYLFFFGIIPSIYIIKAKVVTVKLKKFLITISLSLVFIASVALANASNWLWIDNNATTLGGLVMPWSYTVNTVRFYNQKHKSNKKEILLPDATIKDNKKSVMVVVIGESARSQNFSLYGYPKNTNPLLSKTPNLYHFEATACATYTTAALKCILEHKRTNDLYEILPNYLYRNNVDVVWRTTNWGEPPVHIKHYQNSDALIRNCNGEDCNYDGVLLSGLKDQILTSENNKILVILHTSTSHGPTYSKKYPPRFEIFTPVCNSVELGNCSYEELINAYDNTIVYTDYLLHSLIETLKELEEYDTSMIYVSDHGESLGEKNLYMHGVPMSIAPKEQYEIPFIVWMSDSTRQLKSNESLTQNHVFHSVLNFLGVESPIYEEELNIYK